MLHYARSFVIMGLISLLGASAFPARADVLISNMPGNDGTQSIHLQGGRIKAMGFTMTTAVDYYLDEVVLRLNISSFGVNPLIRIFDNNASNLPQNSLVTLTNPPISATGINNYVFTPPAPFVLQAGQSYWLVVYNVGDPSLWWMANGVEIVPTGLATHLGSLFNTTGGPNPPTTPSNILNSYQINGTPVPAPAGMALLAIGFIGARRRR